MVTEARDKGLDVSGIVADVLDFTPDGTFDILLIDRTLHMLADDDQISVLASLLHHVAPSGYVLIADEKSNMQRFKGVISATKQSWKTLTDKGGYLFLQAI